MAKKAVSLFLLALCSCTVNVQDKRLTREEVALAFQQRDAAIERLIESVKALEEKKK